MLVINYNNYSNPYDESNDNKTKIKEWIKQIMKVLLACAVIKTIIIEIGNIKLLVITIITITVIMIINNSNL